MEQIDFDGVEEILAELDALRKGLYGVSEWVT